MSFKFNLSSENVDCSSVGKDSTTEDTENANKNSDTTASNPMDTKQTECQTVSSNNNWWGSWISSAKTKVHSLNFHLGKKSNMRISIANSIKINVCLSFSRR